jgi:hypothetical protein
MDSRLRFNTLNVRQLDNATTWIRVLVLTRVLTECQLLTSGCAADNNHRERAVARGHRWVFCPAVACVRAYVRAAGKEGGGTSSSSHERLPPSHVFTATSSDTPCSPVHADVEWNGRSG